MLSPLFETIAKQQESLSKVRPFSGKMLTVVKDFYRVSCTWSSTAIEGYGYTELETKILLEDGLTAGGKPLSHAMAVQGHATAYDTMFTLLQGDTILEKDILLFHSLLGDVTNGEFGKYRDIEVIVSGSKYSLTSYKNIQLEMDMFFTWLNSSNTKEMHPLEEATLAHQKFVYIHPFADGNGRVARLLMNTLLIQQGYLPIAIPPVLRHEYFAALEAGRTNKDIFVKFIAKVYKENTKDFLRLIHATNEDEENIGMNSSPQ